MRTFSLSFKLAAALCVGVFIAGVTGWALWGWEQDGGQAGTKRPASQQTSAAAREASAARGDDALSSSAKQSAGNKPQSLPQAPKPAPKPSTIAQFADESAKQAFLTQNKLTEADIKPVPLTDAYQVARAPESLSSTAGVTTHQNQVYRTQLKPDDPFHPQWFTRRLGLEDTWSASTGSNGVTVAVIDTGFALEHEDLAGRWRINPGEEGVKANNKVDDDHNGLVDDWRGWDFRNLDNNPNAGASNPHGQSVSHGTAVAGVLAAQGNNKLGTAGIDWGARVLPLQVMSDDGFGYTTEIVAAMVYARSQGAKIINLSVGGQTPDPFLQTAVDGMIASGAVVVAAAGNDGCECLTYPARYPGVIAVGATDESDNWAPFSNYGPNLDVVAPGIGPTRSTFWSLDNPTAKYDTFVSGTSVATPVVSGIASLFMAANPAATASDTVEAVTRGADKVYGMGGSPFTSRYGYGRVNAYTTNRLASLTHPDGTLVINQKTGGVYLLEKGTKRPIPNPPVFLSYYRDVGRQAKAATLADLALPDGPLLNFRPGAVVKGSGPGIFVLAYQGGVLQRHPIPSPYDYQQMGYVDGEWIGVPDSLLNSLPVASFLTAGSRHPDGTFVRKDGTPGVFLLEGGKRRAVPSPGVMQSINKGKFAVRPATAADMAVHEAGEGEYVPFEEGAIIAGPGAPIYIVDHDNILGEVKKRHIRTPFIHNLLGFTERERIWVPTANLPPHDGDFIE